MTLKIAAIAVDSKDATTWSFLHHDVFLPGDAFGSRRTGASGHGPPAATTWIPSRFAADGSCSARGSWRCVALGGLAVAFKGTFSDEFKVPGTESQQAIELIQRNVPNANADGATGRVVFAAPGRREARRGAASAQAVKRARRRAGRRVGSRRRRSSPRTAASPTPTCSSRSPEADVGATQTDAIEARRRTARRRRSSTAGRPRRWRASRRSARCSAWSWRCSCSRSPSGRCWPPGCRC